MQGRLLVRVLKQGRLLVRMKQGRLLVRMKQGRLLVRVLKQGRLLVRVLKLKYAKPKSGLVESLNLAALRSKFMPDMLFYTW